MDNTLSSGVNAILSSVNDFVSEASEWVEAFAGAIVEHPILLIFCVAVPLCGLGIGLLRRLIHT